MRHFTKLMALVLGLALVAGACGDDGGGGGGAASTDDPLVQAIVDQMMAEDDTFTTDRAEAECFAAGVVGTIGTERLAELGVTAADVGDIDDPDWTEAEATVLVDNMFDCTDIATAFVESFADDDMTDEQTACVADAFGEDTLRSFLVAAYTGEEPANFFAEVTRAMTECGLDPLG